MITNDDILGTLTEAIQSGDGIRLAVSGRSMGPKFATVLDIRIVPCEPSSVPVGRLIVFQRDGRWVVHRVMRRLRGATGAVYLTKGDGLAGLDQPDVQASEVKGVVSGVRSKNGITVDLLSFRSRFRARWIVMRFWLGAFISPTGRDPRPVHPV